MNRIILDELKRRWWFWVLVALSCLVLSACAAAEKNFFYGAFYPAILTITTLTVQLRYGRILLTLPFTARQIGRTVWMLNVMVPSILLVLFTGLGMVIFSHLRFLKEMTPSPDGLLEAWFRLAVVGSLGFGSAFWLFSGVPPKREQWENLRAQLLGFGILIAIVGGGYWLAKSAINDEIKFLTLCIFGIFFTVQGWFRAESAVIEYGAYRKEIPSVAKPHRTFQPRAGYGGIPFLIINCCIRYVAAMACLAAIIFVVILWFVRPDPSFKWSDLLVVTKVFRAYSIPLCLWLVLPMMVHQKFLRSLPLTSKELAAVILSLPVVPFLILCGILALLDIQMFGVPAALSLLKGEFLYLPPICVLATAIVWNNEKNFLRFVIALVIFIVSTIPAMYLLIRPSGKDLPLWMIIVIPVLSCLLALYIINRLLQKNDMTYRVQMQNFINSDTIMW